VTEDSSITLQTVIDQFKNISPELGKALIFKRDGEIVASIENNIKEDQAQKIASSYDEIAKESGIIGGLETLSIQGPNNQLEITSANNHYLAALASRAAEEKMVKALACVIVPTVIKLLDRGELISTKNKSPEVVPPSEDIAVAEPTAPEEPIHVESPPKEPLITPEPVIPKPPVNQLLVERIGGLLVPSDAVRVDAELVAKWHDLYGGRAITQLKVETLEGRSLKCKFKPMREAEVNLKGIIQIPERILHFLGTGEGKLVTVKPVVAT